MKISTACQRRARARLNHSSRMEAIVMKMLRFAVLTVISMTMACAATPDAPAENASETTSSVTASTASDDTVLSPELTPRLSCNGAFQACATGPACHHQEGRNIGRLDCPAGTICCQF